ncbi:1-phosphofructokinase family hexose kinase [Lysinibacter cavernae]|uniref:Carbohydrate kinase PfkB domain-containing protein n=1 Tax=Lysinibacter cavernae TaxID=1640652 RepID=A0A7X5R1U4_9MICO|nr:hexose kinase [Lysinibacter cavernae]NIH53825.1 hypothetical protein [Lysinibacter cavernae]
MIVTLTPNPALDHTYSIEQLNRGSSIRTPAAAVRAGGKGVNVSRVLHSQGVGVTTVVPVGGASGREFEAEALASGLALTAIAVAGSTRRSIAIVEQRDGTTTLLNEEGSGYSPAEWDRIVTTTAASFNGASCVVASGSLPPGAPSDLYPRLIGAANRAKIPSIIDVSGQPLLDAAKAGATVLKPNQHELADATGMSDPIEGARHLLSLGATAVVVSLGEDGMRCVQQSSATVWSATLDTQLVGNPTGAGDASVAALAATLSSSAGLDLSQIDWAAALTLATAWSASAVLTPTAGELHPSWPQLAQRVTVRQL